MKSSSEVLLGRYRLGEVVGVGGMGTVVRAQDEVLDRTVAIKFLKQELAADEQVARRFRREARIAASLAHPGIAQVFDFAEEDGRAFIVMEMLDGQDLHALLSRHGPLDAARAAGIVAQAADALDHAHTAGAVHRDVKPGNIFLTSGGAVKVTDFGIACAAAQAPVTDAGMMMGTSFYISPEQARGERPTPAGDVYSLGCVLFQLLTGRPPFNGESSVAIAMAHLSEPIPSAQAIDRAIPAEIDAIVRRALAKDPRGRFPSAGAMAAALRQSAGQAMPDASSSADTPWPLPLRLAPEAPIRVGASPPGTEILPADTPEQARTRLPDVIPARGARAGRARRRIVAVAALAATLLFLGAAGRALWTEELRTLPGWVGAQVDRAGEEARRMGLEVQELQRSSERPKGEILEQEPGPGAGVRSGDTVKLYVSRENLVKVPDVRSRTVETAKDVLSRSGLRHEVVKEEDFEDVEGMVIRMLRDAGLNLEDLVEREELVVQQNPNPGALAARGTTVELTIVEKLKESGPHSGRGKGKDRRDD